MANAIKNFHFDFFETFPYLKSSTPALRAYALRTQGLLTTDRVPQWNQVRNFCHPKFARRLISSSDRHNWQQTKTEKWLMCAILTEHIKATLFVNFLLDFWQLGNSPLLVLIVSLTMLFGQGLLCLWQGICVSDPIKRHIFQSAPLDIFGQKTVITLDEFLVSC